MEKKETRFSLSNFVKFGSNNFSLILIVLGVFVFGFSFGSLWKENKTLGSKTDVPAIADSDKAAPAAPVADEANNQAENMPEITKNDHTRGTKNPKITLVEYSDFQCPFCNRIHPTYSKILENYGDDVAWVYRHYPLDAIHPNARPAAEMSECVAEYGSNDKFWEFIDIIYERIKTDTDITTQKKLYEVVAEIGLNLDKIKSCVESNEMKEVVEAQIKGGSSAGVRGTPATILVTADGEYEFLSGALPYESFEQKIKTYLE